MSASPVSTEAPTAAAAVAVTVEATAEEVPAATVTEADASKRIHYSHIIEKTDSQNRESVFLFEKASLKGIALLQPLLEQPDELGIAEQPPWGGVDETGRDFPGEALYVQVRAEALEQVCNEI